MDVMPQHESLKVQLVKNTFYFAYVLLITTGTVTFIEAIRTKDPNIRHIMNLETVISVIAAFFYSRFMDIIKESEAKNEPIPYDKINLTRYVDWFISTPFMLMVLCIVLALEAKIPFTISVYAIVLLLDIAMLTAGYLGEIKIWSRPVACFVGFVAFAALFGFLWLTFLHGRKKTFGALLSYTVFIIVWAMYGFVYLLDEEKKNIAFNILDTISKAFVGIFFWMYFTKVIVF